MTGTTTTYRYPRQFWFLIGCLTVNRMAASLICPFITLFISVQTGASLSQVTSLLPIQSVATIIGISGISMLYDRYGRKRLMIGALIAFALLMFVMSQANSLLVWAALIGIYGTLQPLFMVGTNAMVADIIDEPHRTSAYAIVRMMGNVSIALGPAIGGQFIAQSRLFAYYGVAAANLLLVIPVALLLVESLPKRRVEETPKRAAVGYGEVVRDRPFVRFIFVLVLVEVAAAIVFNLLSVYTKTYYGIPENQFGWLLTINAGMVVLFQFGVTRLVSRFPSMLLMTVSAVFYTVAMLLFGFSTALPAFMISMAVMTVGELLLAPTATGIVASLAPPDKRARYMGIYTLTYSAGAGIGPAIGGFLADAFAPQAIWFGGGVGAAGAVIGFFLLSRTAAFRQTSASDARHTAATLEVAKTIVIAQD